MQFSGRPEPFSRRDGYFIDLEGAFTMSFAEEYQNKLVSAAEAAAVVKSGDWVDYGWGVATPQAIDEALAARIGEVEKAYQLFLHATRLDLDDYNNETHQGLHITSMPGSWLAIVRGFAGMQILEGILSFFPVIPEKWNSYSFQINYQGRTLHMHVGKEINISLIAGEELNIQVYKNVYKLKLGTDLLLRIEE